MNIFRADFLIVRIECDPTTGGQRQDNCQREYSVLNFQNAAKLGVWGRLLKLKQAAQCVCDESLEAKPSLR